MQRKLVRLTSGLEFAQEAGRSQGLPFLCASFEEWPRECVHCGIQPARRQLRPCGRCKTKSISIPDRRIGDLRAVGAAVERSP